MIQLTSTTDHDDDITITQHDGFTFAQAVAGRDVTQTRVAWPINPDDEPSLDQAVRVTVCHSGFPVQEGVALRMDGAKMLTVSKNIWTRQTHLYNVHGWDPDTNQESGLGQLLGQFNLSQWLSYDAPHLPRRMAVQVNGDQLSFRVWTIDRPRPDIADSATLTIPEQWMTPGLTGLYGAHFSKWDPSADPAWAVYEGIKSRYQPEAS